jgi:hypothetical protein
MSSFAEGDLQVINQLDTRYLFNHRDVDLKHVQLADLRVTAIYTEVPIVFRAPVYVIEDLPSQSYTELPPPRRKAGYSLWRIDKATWVDGERMDPRRKLSELSLWGGATFSQTEVQCKIEHIHTEPMRPAKTTG